MKQLDDGLLFYLWFVVGSMLILFPTFMMIKANSLQGAQFDKEFPELAWLRAIYTFIPIVWIPFSIIFIGRSLQTADKLTFFVFIVFIPLIGLGILKGLMEIIFKFSIHLSVRMGKSVLSFFTRNTLNFRYYFSCDAANVQLVGFIRLVVNVGLLAAMIYFLL
jgi:hypothetical protein